MIIEVPGFWVLGYLGFSSFLFLIILYVSSVLFILLVLLGLWWFLFSEQLVLWWLSFVICPLLSLFFLSSAFVSSLYILVSVISCFIFDILCELCSVFLPLSHNLDSVQLCYPGGFTLPWSLLVCLNPQFAFVLCRVLPSHCVISKYPSSLVPCVLSLVFSLPVFFVFLIISSKAATFS